MTGACSLSTKIKLNDGYEMPLFGVGTYLSKSGVGASAEKSVEYAVKLGYRLVDTAEYYENETDVGQGIINSKIPREEIFVVTKLWDQGYDVCKAAVTRSLQKLKTGYIDLYLIHSPLGGRIMESYNAMLELQKAGLIRSVGVSNFGVHHLEALREAGKPTPAVNQVELHPYCNQEALVKYCRSHNIAVMGYTPLARGHYFQDPLVKDMAQRHNKTVAQIMLRWSVQAGYITIPKSDKKERLQENANIFDFTLSEDEMNALNSCPQKPVTWNPVDSPWTG